MNNGKQQFVELRAKCRQFAEAHVKDFCDSFDVEKANKLLPAQGKDGAQTNSLDKPFITSLGKLEHLRAI